MVSNFISNWPRDLLPGFINGGMLGRELIIDTFFKAGKNDSSLTTGARTVLNGIIRGSALAFLRYNVTSLAFLARPSNAIVAGYKTIRAIGDYREGAIKEGNKKFLEATCHVALFGIDCFLIWPLLTTFRLDVLGAIYIVAGAAMDISKCSGIVHNILFSSEQEILDRRHLHAEGYSSDYDESSAESSDGDMTSSSSSSSGSDYRGSSEEAMASSSSSALREYESHESDSSEFEGGFVEGDDSDELTSEEERRDDFLPDLHRRNSVASPIGRYERSFVERSGKDPRMKDKCNKRKTVGGMQLRDNETIKRPSRFFSP